MTRAWPEEDAPNALAQSPKISMRYLAIVEKSTKSFGAYVPDLPGCAVVAETREEAMKLIRGAIALHLESLRDAGNTIPEPTSTTEYVQV